MATVSPRVAFDLQHAFAPSPHLLVGQRLRCIRRAVPFNLPLLHVRRWLGLFVDALALTRRAVAIAALAV